MQYKTIKGVKCFNPEAIELYSDFPSHGFEFNQEHLTSNFWARSRNRLFKNLLIQESVDLNNVYYLDIGCNNASFIKHIINLSKFVITATDIHIQGLISAKKIIPNVDFYQMDVTKTVLKKNKFDLITMFDVLEHIIFDVEALLNINKMLKKNGKLIISVPQYQFLWSDIDDLVNHQRRYNKKDIISKLERSGFKIKYSTSFIFLLFPFMFFSRIFSFSKVKFKTTKEKKKELASKVHFSRPTNLIFDLLMRIDEALISSRLSLPFGGTLLIIATK